MHRTPIALEAPWPRDLRKVCFGCGLIARPDGSWHRDEARSREQQATSGSVSHGLCAPCFERLYGQD